MGYSINNLEFIAKSRKKPKVGDLFVLKFNNKGYLFGKVIKLNVDAGFGGSIAILIYIYPDIQNSYDNIPKLDKFNLLIPPLMINQRPWLDGFFLTIANQPLVSDDYFEQHCFADSIKNRYYDEYGNEYKKPIGNCPVGEYGLASYGAVNTELSKVFKVPIEE